METGDYDTNTLVINNIASVAFRVYEPPTEHAQSFASAAIEVETTLRGDGHLVFYDTSRRGVWCFRIREKDAPNDDTSLDLGPSLEVCGYKLASTEEGDFAPLSLQKPQPQAPTPSGSSVGAPSSAPAPLNEKDAAAYENFIASILLALSTAFCSAVGSTPLNYRTVLLPQTQITFDDGHDAVPEDDAVCGTFAAYLTTTGCLVTTFKVSQCRGLLPLDNHFASGFSPSGQNIFAAPFGIQATNPSTVLGDWGTTSLAQTPNTQALSFRGPLDVNEGSWRQACLKALQFRGISPSSLEGCQWISINVSRRRLQALKSDTRRLRDVVTISWPKPLCFRQRTLESSSISRLGYNVLNGHEESHDPLESARHWLDSAADREQVVARRKDDRPAASAPMDIDSHGPSLPQPSGHTPAAVGRPSTAVVGAMYPTPPDGIQPPSGITPNFDGTVSSPRNHHSAAPHGDPEDMGEIPNAPDEMWQERSAPRRENSGDNNNLLDHPENVLIGGGEMFGDNDITEDDFNFFDEEPDDMDLAMADFGADTPKEIPELQPEEPPPPPPTAALTRVETAFEAAPSLDSGGFMKPELKHARSFLTDAQNARPSPQKLPAIKRGTSPFNDETVFKRVRGSIGIKDENTSPVPLERRNSIFEQVDFGPTLPMINKKYQQGGVFAFDQSVFDQGRTGQKQGALPVTNYLKRHSKNNRRPKELAPPTNTLIKRFTDFDATNTLTSPLGIVGSPSEDGRSSIESDEDDSSYASGDGISPTKSNFRRPAYEEDVASPVTSFRDHEGGDEPDQQLAVELPRLSKPEPPEVQLSRLFLDPEPLPFQLPLSDDDIVNIAQLVTEQAATGFLSISDPNKEEKNLNVLKAKRQQLSANARDCLEVLHQVVPLSLIKAQSTRLKGFLEVPDVPLAGQPSLLKPRPIPGRDPNAEHLKPSNLYQIPCHHLEVKRAESRLSVLPTAVTFWESLGLAPASGGKSIHGLCVFPCWTGMMDNVRTFLERVKSMYELLRLGTFEKLPLSGELMPGLVPFEVDRISTSPDASVTGHGSALIESMDVLQSAISSMGATETNFVVYMIYTPSNPGTIVEACLAFQRFVETYWKPLLKKEQVQRELVLQLVSADLVSSPTSLVMTASSDLAKLCLETYDRCTSFGGPVPAPAIILEQALPRIIDFKLTNTPSASLIHENSCIHVAYARSVDDRWVSAAWTDDRGSQQSSASYCLGRKGRPLSASMNEVAHEIWESTLEIISHFKVQWRIIITKSGNMEPSEIEFWADLARTESTANISLILMTVDTNPTLQLLPPAVQVPSSTNGFYTTPVSTPQANIVSPEQSATPATPMQDIRAATAGTPGAEPAIDPEADAALQDVTDQTWGAVVGHRLNNSSTPLELQPALVSGYLIKRTSTKVEDPPTVMEVNLVHTEATGRVNEPLLREMLSYFRGLSTLARARGVVEREADVRPWHVAAAEKAVRALHMLM